MKKLLSLLSLVLFSHFTQAFPGLIGTEISYKELGNSKFEINVYMYEPCSVSYAFQSPQVVAQCSSSTITFYPSFVSKVDITEASLGCNINSCSNGNGYWKWRFSDTIDLSSYSCCEWTIHSQFYAARNATTGSNGQLFFAKSVLNKCSSNIAFEFKQDADFSHTVNQDETIKFEAYNSLNTGDSVSYELVGGLQALLSNITYSGQFSPVRPMTFFGFPNQNLQWPAGCRLNSNGELRFRPTLANQVFVVVVEAKLWRSINGVMTIIGRIRRDIEGKANLGNTNSTPFLESAGSGQFSGPILLSAGFNKSFNLLSDDADSLDEARIEVLSKPQYLDTSLVKRLRTDSLHLNFKPSLSDTALGIPDTLRLKVYDLVCPNQGIDTITALIYVLPKPELQFSKDSSCANWTITHSVSTQGNALLPLDSRWDIYDPAKQQLVLSNPSQAQQFLQQGPYYVYVYYGYQGMQEYVDSFYLNDLNPYLNVSHTLQKQDTVCLGDTAFLSLTLNGDTNQYKSHWFLGSDSNNRAFQITSSGLQIYSSAYTASEWVNLWVYDTAGCVYLKDSARLKYYSPAASQIADASICEGDTLNLQINRPEGYQLEWSNASQDTAVFFTTGGTKWLKLDQNGYCPDLVDSFTLTVNPNPELRRFSDTVLCPSQALSVEVLKGSRTMDFYWDGQPQPGVNSYDWVIPGNYLASVKAVEATGCSDSFAFQLKIPNTLTAQIMGGLIHNVCRGDSLLIRATLPAPGYTLEWSNGSTDTFAYFKKGNRFLTSISPEGCEKTTVFLINERPRPNPAFSFTGVSLSYQFSAFNNFPYQHFWDFGDGTTDTLKNPAHTYMVSGLYTVKHRIVDDLGCDSTAVQAISVINGVQGSSLASLRFYPIPTRDVLLVDWGELDPGTLEIQVYDLAGKQVWTGKLLSSDKELSLRAIAPGTYRLTWKGAETQGMSTIQITP